MIHKYFEEIEKTILYFQKDISYYSVNKKVYSEKQGFIKGTIVFHNQYKLDFIEVKDINTNFKDKYSYHFMDENNILFFRYDNANHHKEITTYPHHKHLSTKIIESSEPTLFDVLIEIKEIMVKKG
jgi:hypothetical protein